MPLAETSSSRTRAAVSSRLRWLYPVALAAMVVTASGRGQVAGPEIVNFDKLVHFSVFGLLATLVARAPGIRRPWMAVLAVSFFGMSDEIRQGFTPGRSMAFADWVADTAGACLAVVLHTCWPAYRRLLELPLDRKSRRAVASVLVSDQAASAPAA
jgi:VanZ family protein